MEWSRGSVATYWTVDCVTAVGLTGAANLRSDTIAAGADDSVFVWFSVANGARLGSRGT